MIADDNVGCGYGKVLTMGTWEVSDHGMKLKYLNETGKIMSKPKLDIPMFKIVIETVGECKSANQMFTIFCGEVIVSQEYRNGETDWLRQVEFAVQMIRNAGGIVEDIREIGNLYRN